MSSSSKLLQCFLLLMFTLALAQNPTTITTPNANITTTPPTATSPPTAIITTPDGTINTTGPTATSPPTAIITTPNKTINATGPSATTPPTTVITTSNNTVTTTPVKPTHKFNGEVQPFEICLDGADNSYVYYDPAVGDFGTNNFTVALWVQTSETLPLFDIVGNRNESGQGNYFQMRMSGVDNPIMPAGQVLVEVDQDATGLNYANITSNMTGLNDGNWHYLVFVRDGLNLALYVDGALDNQVTATGVANITTPVGFRVGRSVEAIAGPRFAPVACYAELRVYARALNATQIGNVFDVQGAVY